MTTVFEVLKYFGPVLGVVIGWLLTRTTDRKKIKYERHKQINRILFILLEIRKHLLRPVMEEKVILNGFQEAMKRAVIILSEGKESIEGEEIFDEATKDYILQLVKYKLGFDNETSVSEMLDSSIQELSFIDPVLAHKLGIYKYEIEAQKTTINELTKNREAAPKPYKAALYEDIIQSTINEFDKVLRNFVDTQSLPKKRKFKRWFKSVNDSMNSLSNGKYTDVMTEIILETYQEYIQNNE